MRQTTVLIRSTIEENSRVRVYWRWAVPSKSWSRARGFRAFSRVARTMTLTGASRANCSKTSPRSMGVASPESGYLQVQRQVSRNIGPPTQGWSLMGTSVVRPLAVAHEGHFSWRGYVDEDR